MIGNGGLTFLWNVSWHAIGPLFKHCGRRVVFNLKRPLAAKVRSIIVEGGWHWHRSRNSVIQEIKMVYFHVFRMKMKSSGP